MAIYTMRADLVERRARAFEKARSITIRLVVAILIVDVFLICLQVGWISKSWRLNEHLFIALMIGSFTAIIQFLRPSSWRKPAEAALARLQVQTLEMDSEQVTSENGTWSRSLRRDQILRAEEPHKGLGLYLRTSNPFRWLLIPKGIDGYEEIKADLAANGILISRDKWSPEWMENLAFLMVMASMTTELISSNREVMLMNLAFSIVLATAGVFIASGKGDNRKLKWKYGVFYCIPLIFALAGWHWHH